MPPKLEVIPNQKQRTQPFFTKEEDYRLFREAFIADVAPKIEETMDARRKSEQEARERLLR